MTVRYIFRTSGEYVAFLSHGHLFDPSCEWIGFVGARNAVYNPSGEHIGYLLADDRIGLPRAQPKLPRVQRPLRPLRPMRPLKPLRRLRMPKLPVGWVDIFERTTVSSGEVTPTRDYARLLGARLVAANNVFLGRVSQSQFEADSIRNEFGAYGSRFSATSIFNEFCPYGGQFGTYSPFNPYGTQPPMFLRDNAVLAVLSINKYLPVANRIDAADFVLWLRADR